MPTRCIKPPHTCVFRYEYVNDPSELSLPGVTRVRLTSGSNVNVNASSASVGTLVDAAVAYNKVTQMEEEARKEGQKVNKASNAVKEKLILRLTGYSA
jgi:hypothetical protein